MKKIFNFIFTVTALLAFAPIAGAQTYGQYSIKGQIQDTYYAEGNPKRLIDFPKDNGLQENTDFAYSKNISAPFSDGTYWIKLESYATGAASRIESAAPADIVLVLDLSSSMSTNYVSFQDTDYKPRNAGWRYNDTYTYTVGREDSQYGITHYYYYIYEGGRYQVDPYRYSRGGNRYYYFLTFTDSNDQQHFLLGNTVYDSLEAVVGASGNGNDAENETIWTGNLIREEGDESRLDALKRATVAFIDVIDKNDYYEDENYTTPRTGGRLGNRISIITFNSAANVRRTLGQGALSGIPEAEGSTGETLKALVNGFTTDSGTRQDLGITGANNQLRDYVNAARKLEASQTVVIFTDGEPYDGSNERPYNPAIQNALTTKTEYGATVFTVDLFSKEPQPGETLWNFMNYMSSNAPSASSLTSPGNDFDSTLGYYKDASGENADLTAVFTEIAHQSSGSTTSLSAASSNVDVVSNSFVLPPDVNASTVSSRIKIFIARVDSAATRAAGGTLVFEEEIIMGEHIPADWTYQPLDQNGAIIPGQNPKRADAGVNVSLVGDNGIKVTGFDYSSAFCGPIYKDGYTPTGTDVDKQHVDHYQGFKIIIMIPILANQDAVGGPNVDTNAPGSGIYVTDGDESAYVEYISPTVSLPYNFFLQKEGLQPGESAKFKLERAFIPTNASASWKPSDLPESAWSYVSTVFVTQPMGAAPTNKPIVKVRGLPSTTRDLPEYEDLPESQQRDYVYRITEEKWTWSYHRDGAQYSDKSKVDNPFYFENDKKTGIELKVRHAESKATNIFNGTSTNNVKYDDSKNNTSSTGGDRY